MEKAEEVPNDCYLLFLKYDLSHHNKPNLVSTHTCVWGIVIHCITHFALDEDSQQVLELEQLAYFYLTLKDMNTLSALATIKFNFSNWIGLYDMNFYFL